MRPTCPRSAILAIGLAGTIAGTPAQAEERDPQLGAAAHPPQSLEDLRRVELCGPPLAPPPTPEQQEDAQAPLVLEAQTVTADMPLALYRLRGNAELRQRDQRFRSDAIDLQEAEGQARLPRHFSYTRPGLHLWGHDGRFDLVEDRLEMEDAEFRAYPHMHGAARELTVEGQTSQIQLQDLRYSTCPPGDASWWLRAGSLTIDQEEGSGYARDARIEVGGVPLLYTPHLQFPLGDSPRTGALPPSFGQSKTHGGHITVPVYVRLAPNYDLTLQPTYYSRRGLHLGLEGRYLQPMLEGKLQVEHIRHDQAYKAQLEDKDEGEAAAQGAERWALDWAHNGDLGGTIQYGADVDRVSDPDYLRDFSSSLLGTSASELESRAWAQGSWRAHSWEAELQHWQNLRPEDRPDPYRRWPSLTYAYTPGQLPAGLDFRLEAEATRFKLPRWPEAKQPVEEQRPAGDRYHAQPQVTWPIHRQAFFLEPALSLHHTTYKLDHEDTTTSLERTVPVGSLDTGIFLERPFTLGDRPYRQTLEPRLHYLYIPYRDQEAFPVFETSEQGNSVAQLFRENRFSGIDRIGDANQVTAALTTRFRDVIEGTEPFQASVGQVYYLQDRRVTLDSEPEQEQLTRSRSDIFADAEAHLPTDLRLRAEYRYDPRRDRPVATSLVADWQYQPTPQSLINLAYRVREGLVEGDGEAQELARTQDFVEASAVAPLNAHWRALGAWRYSRLERRNLEVVAGVEYRDCCWGMRGVVRRFRRGAGQQLENTFMVEFELTGLGGLGQDTASFLEDVVPAYEQAVF